ncbi:MAG: mannitol dehydrogenase family protein [Roseinatronobacter sp.]
MDELTPLRRDRLADLRPDIARPRYARGDLSPGIVHIGLGNFHRAHQAWYTHRLMQHGLARDWAIIGAGVRPTDAAMREKLLAQDGLSTLIELDPAGKSAEVTGAMVDFIAVEPANEALIARMAQRDIRIVSLTVTEGGYYRDPETGALDLDHADIRHDSAHPEHPRTPFGAMIAALRQRRATGLGPFTGLSCDNLQGNGAILRQTVLGLAAQSDPQLADWIAETCSFPNSMVDCIVPATGPREIALAQSFGIDDRAPVTHERFRQWVIEDDFCAGRPPWEKVGAVFTPDVHVYETMKIRILNGGHQVVCAAGELLGLGTIADSMAHPGIAALLHRTSQAEIAPHVTAPPGISVAAYIDQIAARFANREIRDTTRRVAFDGSSRHAGFLLPSIRDGLRAGTPVAGLALASALWARYCLGRREDGSEIAPNDPLWPDLSRAAHAAQADPAAWLEHVPIYGELKDATRFADAFAAWFRDLRDSGTEATLARFAARSTA